MAETDRDNWGVAIVGMAGRFPGARNVDELWNVLVEGRETVRDLTDAELREHELDFDAVASDPAYVRRRGILEDADMFDAGFFSIPPREASMIDPQQRVWLETTWDALEDAALAPAKFAGKVGVFGGSYINGYLLYNLCRDRGYIEKLVRFRAVDAFQALISNDKDYITTRTSYKLDLTGPSVNVQTACSTSLVAVCQAVKSLLNYESDACIAGGVAIPSPQFKGYLYQEGAMTSRDGRCRPFDADASGTVFSAGVGIVVLKRLDDALAHGDRIRAVIKGVAVNNDGSNKVSFTAPSVDGQAEVIAMAQAMADIDPATISYIEAHGTATPLGDPIEVAALTKAFRMRTGRRRYCGLGSVKSNVGHLDAASGVAGLIKTVLAMEHRVLPPSLHYRAPNPQIDFGTSPFFVVDELRDWRSEGPLRAGVSSFGVGGTNAHVVLEEAPERASNTQGSAPGVWQVLPLSARTEAGLARRADDLRARLDGVDADMPSLARTLQEGRADFEHRRVVVARTRDEAIAALSGREASLSSSGRAPSSLTTIAFMFPGQGAQHANMGRELYDEEPVFRAVVDRCAATLEPLLGMDLREVLFPREEDRERAEETLRQTAITQPALFVIELATAALWQSLGVKPASMIGHSVGEFVAAALAGVMSEEDALRLLAARGRLMGSQPAGSMLAVRLPAEQVEPRLGARLSIAAINAPALCVVSGPTEDVAQLRAALEQDGVDSTELATSHAFHSSMMDPALEPFRAAFEGVRLSPPRVPFISCVTGTWITDAQACDPAYWVSQLRSPVRFAAGVDALASSAQLLLEVGPGRTLATLAKQGGAAGSVPTVASLPHPREDLGARGALLRAAGQLWLNGFALDWTTVRRGTGRMLGLPSYPFERQRYWIEPPARANGASSAMAAPPAAVLAAAAAEPVGTAPAAAPAPVSIAPVDAIADALRAMMKELSGTEFGAAESTTTFLELGLDSLFLTQISSEMNTRFGVRVKFRQLFEDIPTLERLAQHLEREMAPERVAALMPKPVAVPAQQPMQPVFAGAELAGAQGGSVVERLIQEQLRIMQLQLEALRGPAAAAPVAAVAPVAATPAAAAIPVPASYASASASGRFGPYKQIERARDGGLTEAQQAHLAGLIAKLSTRTRGSKEVSAKYRAIQADPRNIASFRTIWKEMVYQIVGTESNGSRLRDVDGNEYVDVTMGFGINLFGHNAEWIRSAISAQLERGFAIGPQGELAGEVAAMLTEMTGMERASFCNTGSEAVMAAMRMARTVTGRDLVVYFAGDYHGVFDEVLARPQVTNGHLMTVPIAPGIPQNSVGSIVVLEFGNPGSLEILRSIGDRVAAVLVEPVQSRHPELRPVEFVRAVRELTTQSGSALIFDEVITGFRTHPGGMQAVYGVRADLAAYGKIIGGGLPIGAVAGSARFMDTLDGGTWSFGDDSVPESDVTFFAGTFVRHPLALAAAKAVLTHLKAEGPGLQSALNERTARFADRVNAFFEDAGVPIRVRQYSSWFRFDFPSDLVYAPLLFFHMLERGVYVREPGQNCFFSTAHSDADIDFVVRIITESTIALQEAGFLPGRVPPKALPLTGAQQEIRVTSELDAEASCSFNEAFRIDFAGRLERDALAAAVEAAVARHEALRMRFSADGATQAAGDLPAAPRFVDLRALAPEAREEALRALMRAEQETPFDLAAGPLLRSSIVALEDERHVFLCTAHHIVFDGWSSAVLIQDIRDGYNAAVRGVTAELAPAERYATFVLDEVAPDATREEDLAWWTARFADLPAPLALPVDRERGDARAFAGETLRWTFSAEAYDAARELARSRGATLYSTLLAAYSVLLHRLTGQEDLVIGIPVAGQSITGRHHLIGHCLNLLPLRLAVRGTHSFARLVDEVKTQLLDANEHQTVSLGAIVRAVNPPRAAARMPLVEVVFNLDRRLPSLDFDGVQASVEECGKRAVNVDLFLNLNEWDGAEPKLTLNLDYSRSLFDEVTVATWMREFESLLLKARQAADTTVAELAGSVLRPERASATGPARELPRHGADELVLEAADEHSTRDAISCGATVLDYATLTERVHALAALLLERGVKAGDRVGVLLERSVDLPVALLAVMRTGAAFVPLDPAFPAERVRFMTADSGLTLLVSTSEVRAQLGLLDVPAVLLDRDRDELGRLSRTRVPSRSSAEAPAYVIYTSGSTGTPKGVVVPHRALVNFLLSMRDQPGLRADDVLVAVTTLSFDISLLELLLPLTTGARVHVATRDEAVDPTRLRALLHSVDASVMQATPTHWRSLLEAGWIGGPRFRALCGGEPLPRDLATALSSRVAELWNMYGPTETTIWSTCTRVGDGPVRIGRPIANTTVRVLDAALAEVPLGVAGELCIGGAGVALGYHHRDELTRERFVADPVEPGRTLYRTGDAGRWSADGQLEHHGRLDDQLKMRGFRVEPGEVEAAIVESGLARQAAVVARRGTAGDDRLVAFLVTGDSSLPADAMRARLSQRLPDYMLPNHWITVPELPRTANGKLDRRELAARAQDHSPESAAVSRAPATPSEQKVARAMAEVLHVDSVPADADFFDLGGHSILAMRVIARLRDEGATLSLRDLFRSPSVAALAARMDELGDAVSPSDAPASERVELVF